ncbi:MAG: penicillin acylase family protein [Chitinophagaceae bacterium]|nr:penicillin acylase family protein [Chitinophagaceae bacterium]
MRFFLMTLFAAVTVALIVILNSTMVLPAPLGKLMSPQHGVWQNAEPYDLDYNATLSFPQLKEKAIVYLDDRLVPHIFAQNDEDALFIQGYLHARFRLWQMEFQARAAGGRLSEIVGPDLINFDRNQRRLGMVFAAENSVKEVEKDPELLAAYNAYTAGVNSYIETLTDRTLPLEYKLMGYQPEKWSNLKSALFLKFMALDLAGFEEDFEMTNARSVFSKEVFQKLYPIASDSLDPIVPKGTQFAPEPEPLVIPESAEETYYDNRTTNNITGIKPDKSNGSNNWAVGGSKTQSGYPILCNDPHLGLNMPSLWYEIQISTPDYNSYGVSFPGAPCVIIGFNDSIAFGFTNAMRDVRDYYEVKFKDESRQEYWFDSAWHKTEFRIEKIVVKGQPDFLDTVAYTNIGPVMYDKSYTGNRNTGNKDYAVRWKAHDPSNEGKTFYLLNRAKNYDDYLKAIKNLQVPGQNCIFSSKTGDIAIWDQGNFPAKWYRQGDFIMEGDNSDYFWQYNIPQEQNPHQVNPDRGFVSSANQLPTDTTYPYYLGGNYPPYRGFEINRRLYTMDNITPEDMMKLQTDNYNLFGEIAAPEIISRIPEDQLNDTDRKYFEALKNWDYVNAPDAIAPTIFKLVWDELYKIIFDDEFKATGLTLAKPHNSTLVDIIKRNDTTFTFYDNINTPEVETLEDNVAAAFKKCIPTFIQLEKEGRLEWTKYKDTRVQHLARIDALSSLHLYNGGGEFSINATKEQHGPSWRMVVQLTPETDAYGVYPGGQSGNPGSRYYDTFIDHWTKGEYYKLWVMNKADAGNDKVKHTMQFNPSTN